VRRRERICEVTDLIRMLVVDLLCVDTINRVPFPVSLRVYHTILPIHPLMPIGPHMMPNLKYHYKLHQKRHGKACRFLIDPSAPVVQKLKLRLP
jgi:hypothetical protein